jgi:hypothetical protein
MHLHTHVIATLSAIAKIWDQLVVHQLMSGKGKINIMLRYYSAIKKGEFMSLAGKWMELEIIMLSEISQTEKDKYHTFPLTCRI